MQKIRCVNLTDQTLSLDLGHITYTLYPKGANFPSEGKVDYCYLVEDDTQHPVVQTFLYGQGGPKIRIIREELTAPISAGDYLRKGELKKELSSTVGMVDSKLAVMSVIVGKLQAEWSRFTPKIEEGAHDLLKRVEELEKELKNIKGKFATIEKENEEGSSNKGGHKNNRSRGKVDNLFT